MIHDPVRIADQPSLPLFDEEALDIADYLKAEGDAEADSDIHGDQVARQGFATLTLGAIGVVYGDIGTSPIYAFREALRATGVARPGTAEVLGILSLLIWSLVLIVTVKYVFFLLRADNRGEGGILALYTLVRLATGRRSLPVLALAIAGAWYQATGSGSAVVGASMALALGGQALRWTISAREGRRPLPGRGAVELRWSEGPDDLLVLVDRPPGGRSGAPLYEHRQLHRLGPGGLGLTIEKPDAAPVVVNAVLYWIGGPPGEPTTLRVEIDGGQPRRREGSTVQGVTAGWRTTSTTCCR